MRRSSSTRSNCWLSCQLNRSSFSRVPDSDAAPYPLERRRFYILAVNSMLALMQCLNWFTFSSVDVARVRGYYGAHVIGGRLCSFLCAVCARFCNPMSPKTSHSGISGGGGFAVSKVSTSRLTAESEKVFFR